LILISNSLSSISLDNSSNFLILVFFIFYIY
jgi:hypothetical protein